MSKKSDVLMRLSLVLPLLVVVLVSGCIGGGNTDGVTFGDGVSIQGWEPDFSSLNSYEHVKFFLKVQNQGEATAQNVKSIIMGIDTKTWGLSRSDNDFGSILPPDSTTNTPGEVKTFYYTGMTAPALPVGTSFTFEPIVRVSYDYKTSAQKSVTVVDVEELRRLIQQGKSLPSKESAYTSGPLSIEIKTGDFVKTQKEDDPFPIYILITNKLWESGGSVVRGTGSPPSGFDYPVNLKISMPAGGSIKGDKCSSNGVWVDLWQGKTAEITCQITVDAANAGTRVERLMTAELNYRFQVEAQTSVTVNGANKR